jgi:hypothetical protein
MTVRSLYFGKDVKHLMLLIAALAAAPLAAHPELVEEEQLEAPPPPRGGNVLREAVLATHNVDRVKIKLVPLVWDNGLAKDAEIWAQELARRNMFEHAPREKGVAPQGENLWMGTRDAYAVEEMTGMWLDERQLTRDGVFPDVSTSGKWQDVAHFTQMLWPATQAVGCALASNAEDDFLVCRYLPAGNRIGDDFSVTSRK